MSGGTGFFETMVDLENMLPTLPGNNNSFSSSAGSLDSAFNLFPLLEQINENIDDIFIGQIIIIDFLLMILFKVLI